MTIDRNLLDKLRSRGEEVLTQLSSELMSNPRFVKAMEGAMRGREKLEQAAASALEQMNVPTRGDLDRANSRIEALEREIAALRARTRAARAKAAPTPARPHAQGEEGWRGETEIGARQDASPDEGGERAGQRPLGSGASLSRIAITGTASYLGSRILRRLVESRGRDSVVSVDITPPPTTLHGVRYRMVDLTLPGADQRLVDVFREEMVDTVVHAAFFTTPRRDAAYAHELESIGTLHLAAAAAAGGVRHLLLRSFTAVYGARGQNPNFLSEERRPDLNARLAWVRDKVEAEEHAFSFARRYPTLGVTVLRFATLLGPGVHTFYTRVFSKRVVPFVLGYDPAGAAAAPGRCARGQRARAGQGAVRRRQRRPEQHPLAADRAAPGREAHRGGAARGRLPARRHVVGRRSGRGAGRLHRLRPLPVRRRRREGAARAGLRAAFRQPRRADGVPAVPLPGGRGPSRRRRRRGRARRRGHEERLQRRADRRAAAAAAGAGGGRGAVAAPAG